MGKEELRKVAIFISFSEKESAFFGVSSPSDESSIKVINLRTDLDRPPNYEPKQLKKEKQFLGIESVACVTYSHVAKLLRFNYFIYFLFEGKHSCRFSILYSLSPRLKEAAKADTGQEFFWE